MPLKVKFSPDFDKMQKRIKQLPEIYMQCISTVLKRDAESVIVNFEKGIQQNQLGLERLAESTVASKKAKKQARPKTPLYGEGERDKDSYFRMLQLIAKPGGRGWLVEIRKGNHHSGLTFQHIYSIHEFGVTFQVTPKGGGDPYLVRIPPRPALEKSHNKALRKISRESDAKKIKQAVTAYIKKGRKDLIDKLGRVPKP